MLHLLSFGCFDLYLNVGLVPKIKERENSRSARLPPPPPLFFFSKAIFCPPLCLFLSVRHVFTPSLSPLFSLSFAIPLTAVPFMSILNYFSLFLALRLFILLRLVWKHCGKCNNTCSNQMPRSCNIFHIIFCLWTFFCSSNIIPLVKDNQT